MQRAVEMPGMKTHMFKKIRKQIARALTLRRVAFRDASR